jgi:hypothetical protein
MEVKQLTISPEQATKMLTNNPSNRKISNISVTQYAEDMINKKWMNNGDTIRVFNPTGNPRLPIEEHKLIDGQHRLSACVKAQIPLNTLIVVVDDQKVFETIDTGKKRSPSDTLSIYGHKNCATLAASLALIKKIDRDGLNDVKLGGGSSAKVKNHELLDLLNQYQTMPDSVQYACNMKAKFRTRPAAMAVLHYKFCEIDNDLGEEFLNHLHSGANLSESSPILHLRNAIISRRNSDVQMTNYYIIKACYHGWNNWIQGREVSRLCVPKGQLPKLRQP